MKTLAFLLVTMTVSAATIPDLAGLERMSARFARTELRVDPSSLSAGDQKALVKLIQAARVIDDIFLEQMWSGNPGLYKELQHDKSPLGQARLHYFWLNKGPWSALDAHAAFLPGVPDHKLPGANFYPESMTKEQFDAWAKKHPEAIGFFSVIRQGSKGLELVPYNQAYERDLERAAKLLREAAADTDNATLKRFLTLRAEAFLSNDYYASDVAWMDLDAPIDVTIGPYETYNDEIFGYKAGFEAYVNLRDEQESAKMKFFGDHMQEIEDHLPIDAKYRNPKLGALSPIRVVNEVYAAGDGAHGVRTAAYNLPNDERVVAEKGSKRVMLKNIQEAKFKSNLVPISRRMLAPEDQADLSFDAFFTHILAHEMTHGIGPQQITINGRATSPRQELKELFSALEEAKADATGLFMLQHLYDRKLMPEAEKKLYTTYLASSFRTLRFGINEAHGRGMALQFNYLMDKGAFVQRPDGTYAVDFTRIKAAVRDLVHDLLMLEATGDYARARKMLTELAVARPALQKALAGLSDIPVDIEPIHVTADQLAPR